MAHWRRTWPPHLERVQFGRVRLEEELRAVFMATPLLKVGLTAVEGVFQDPWVAQKADLFGRFSFSPAEHFSCVGIKVGHLGPPKGPRSPNGQPMLCPLPAPSSSGLSMAAFNTHLPTICHGPFEGSEASLRVLWSLLAPQ